MDAAETPPPPAPVTSAIDDSATAAGETILTLLGISFSSDYKR